MESIWEKTCRPAAAALRQSAGGRGRDRRRMTGILTALELQERGPAGRRRRGRACRGGQTGRTTAKLTAQHGAISRRLIERLGREKGGDVRAGQPARRGGRCARIELEHIDCDLERADSWLYSYDREDALLREAEAERRSGWTRRSSRTTLCRCAYGGVAAARAGAVSSAEVPAGAGRPADDLRAHAGRARRGRHAVHPARNDRGRARGICVRRTTRS